MKILLINDTRDHNNWGSQACSSTLIELLRSEWPDSNIVSVPSGLTTRKFKKSPNWMGGSIYWGRRGIKDRFSKPFYGEPFMADEFEEAATVWSSGQGGPFADAVLKGLQNADLALYNAEGSVYRTNLSAMRCLFALWFAASRKNVPSFFVNGTVMLSRTDPILNAIAFKTFQNIQGIAVREALSLHNLQDYLPTIQADVFPDSTFNLQDHACAVDEIRSELMSSLKDRPYFCVSSSMIHSLLPVPLRYGIRTTSLFQLTMALKKLIPEAVILAKDKEDQIFMRALAESTGSLFIGPEIDYFEVIRILKNSRLLVSGRYHHIIFAALSGCPSLPFISTSHKIDGLCKFYNDLLPAPIDPTDIEDRMDFLTDQTIEILNKGSVLRDEIRHVSSVLSQNVRCIGLWIRKRLEGDHS